MEDEETLETGEECETAPGVVVARRSFAKTFAAALAGTSLTGIAQSNAEEIQHSELTFREFLALAAPIAKELLSDTSLVGQDRYLLTLASFAVRVSDVPVPEMGDSGQGTGPGTFIGFNPGGDPFTVLHWKMNPNTAIRLHAHTYGNVVTLGLEGEARVENYEIVGERRYVADASFKARRTREQWLTPGAVNLVNLDRDYIHGSIAGSRGARGLDITTRIRPKEPTPYLAFSEKTSDSGGTRKAVWTFDPPRR